MLGNDLGSKTRVNHFKARHLDVRRLSHCTWLQTAVFEAVSRPLFTRFLEDVRVQGRRVGSDHQVTGFQNCLALKERTAFGNHPLKVKVQLGHRLDGAPDRLTQRFLRVHWVSAKDELQAMARPGQAGG
ncbi:hypothetical protein D3C85_1599650 [compost metagenome]